MRLVSALSIALSFVAVTAAASVDSVSTRQLSAGTTIDVTGSDFARPVQAWLQFGRRRIPLRVLRGATATAFRAALVTHPAGLNGACVLAVRGRGSRVPFQYAGLTIELPAPTGVAPATARAGDEVLIEGRHFGARRGRVMVGTAPGRVLSWSDTAIRTVVPRGVAAGMVHVTVVNRAGRATERPVLTVGP